MHISYNKLWKMLIDKNMTKMDLRDAAEISAASVAKLGKGANITTDTGGTAFSRRRDCPAAGFVV